MLIMEHVDNVRAQLEFYLLVLHFQKNRFPSPPPFWFKPVNLYTRFRRTTNGMKLCTVVAC